MEFKTKIQDKTWSPILESEIAKNWSKDQIYELYRDDFVKFNYKR